MYTPPPYPLHTQYCTRMGSPVPRNMKEMNIFKISNNNMQLKESIFSKHVNKDYNYNQTDNTGR